MTGSNRQPNRQRPWQPDQEADGASFGAWLRRQRELREISLREIADVTKISTRYLEALEQDRFDVLPAPVFAKGFLREYARYVGLDADEVVNSYLTAQSDVQADPETKEWTGERKASLEWTSGLLLALLVVGLLAVVALLAFYAERSGGGEPDATPPPIAAPPVAVQPPAPAPTAAPIEEPAEAAAEAVPLAVTMDFREDCWVEAVVDGAPRLSELHVQGESLSIEAEETVRLRLGNPGGVHIEVNGRPLPADEGPARQPRELEIDLETARALLEPTVP